MKNIILLFISFLWLCSYGCNDGRSQSSKTLLAPAEFSKKLSEMPAAMIIDVRTPGEFSGGHLINATNIDWDGNDFETQIAKIDKSKPVFVYCEAGGRSASAAKKMRSEGFKEVYELSGGFSKWREAKLPETNTPSNGN